MSVKNNKNKKNKEVQIPVKIFVASNEKNGDKQVINRPRQNENEGKSVQKEHPRTDEQDNGFINEDKKQGYLDLNVSPCLKDIIYSDVEFPDSGFVDVKEMTEIKSLKKDKKKIAKHMNKVSEEKRIGLLWIGVAFFSVLIFTGWIMMLVYTDFFKLEPTVSAEEEKSLKDSMEQTFHDLSENLNDQWNAATAADGSEEDVIQKLKQSIIEADKEDENSDNNTEIKSLRDTFELIE